MSHTLEVIQSSNGTLAIAHRDELINFLIAISGKTEEYSMTPRALFTFATTGKQIIVNPAEFNNFATLGPTYIKQLEDGKVNGNLVKILRSLQNQVGFSKLMDALAEFISPDVKAKIMAPMDLSKVSIISKTHRFFWEYDLSDEALLAKISLNRK